MVAGQPSIGQSLSKRVEMSDNTLGLLSWQNPAPHVFGPHTSQYGGKLGW